MHPAAAFFAWLGIFLGFITILTFIHELGHFGVAKFRKVMVAEFSIGFGRAIYQKKIGDTTYSLRWIPFGGYVSVLSEAAINQLEEIKSQHLTPEDLTQINKKLYGLNLEQDYSNKITLDSRPYGTKMMFILGGVMMNFLFGWIAIFAIYMTAGKETAQDTPMITGGIIIDEGQGPESIGDNFGFILDEYTILDDQGNPTETKSGMENFWTDFDYITQNKLDGTQIEIRLDLRSQIEVVQTFKYTRYDITIDLGNGIIVDVPMDTFYATSFTQWTNNQGVDNLTYLAFNTNTMYEVIQFEHFETGWHALGRAFIDSWIMIGMAFVLFFDILTLGFVVPDNPWNEGYLGVEQSAIQINQWVGILAQLSFILFSFNLIPLPPLDGWKATEFTYEELSKKKVQPSTLATLTKIGYLFIALTFILQFFVGWW